jgi:diguanylate cyclase (GGDEF)-like protein
VLWIISAVGILGLAALLLAIVVRRGSRVAIWYGLSLGIMFLSTLYEIIAASFGSRDLIGSINSVTAGLAASIIVALAIAEHLHQEKLQRVKAQFALNHTYETIPIGLFTLDKAGVFVNSNPGIRAILGRRFDEHEFPHWSDFLDPAAWRVLQQRLRFEREVEVEVAGAGNEGHERRFLIKAASSNDLVEGSLQDITERHKAVTQLKHLSEHDSLTGVLNRRGIEARVKDALRRIDVDHPLAIGYLDLDRFKLINDLYGHPTGDRVLQETCSRITTIMRSDVRNLIGRVGGDEFLLAFPEASIGKAEEICQKIISTVEATPCQIGPRAFQVRCSIGVLEVPHGTLVKDAISLSDQACRSAKRSVSHLSVLRRDAHEVAGHTEEMGLIRRFGTDMPPDGLFLDMQPIMSLTAPLASLNFEMLIRMRQPDQSVTPAWKIISAAEHNGRISVIDRWVLETTLQWLDAHRHRLSNTQFVCLNLSGASLNDERFIHDAFAMLDNYRQVASCLCLEITETVALHDMNNTRRFIDRVREFDAKVALDDFGAGYTSFSYLKQLATDVLKIDGMFVRDVTVHPANLSIVQAITELAHNLGMKTVAEWAEDLATVQALASVGVDYVQGYAISRPTTPQQILSATSSASLIVDPDVAHYVTCVLGGDPQRRDQIGGDSPSTQSGLAAILRDDDGHLIH